MSPEDLSKAMKAVEKSGMDANSKKLYVEQLVEYFKVIKSPPMKPMKLKKLKKTKAEKALENIGKNNKAIYEQYLWSKEEKELAAKKAAAQALTVESISKAFGVPPEYLVGGQMKPMQQKNGVFHKPEDEMNAETPNGSTPALVTQWGAALGSTSSVNKWKTYAELSGKMAMTMFMTEDQPTIIALQTKVKELEQKLAKKELQESSLKEPRKRKRIVEI